MDLCETAYETACDKVDTAQESMDTAKKNLEKAGEDDELSDLQDELEECTLVAETSGTVTALNATVGSVCDGTVATIQDTEDLVVDITISEDDVKNVRARRPPSARQPGPSSRCGESGKAIIWAGPTSWRSCTALILP